MWLEKDTMDLVSLAMQSVEENDGVIPEEDLQALADLAKEELLPKMDKMAGALHYIDGDIETVDAEIKRLQERKKSMQKAQENLKKRMLFVVQHIGQQKTALHTFGIRHSQSLEVAENLDFSKIPPEFVKVKQELDKLALKKRMVETGECFEGVAIKENESLNLR